MTRASGAATPHWDQQFAFDGSSLAGTTVVTGTWATNGTEIESSDYGFNELQVLSSFQSFAITLEAEVSIPSGGMAPGFDGGPGLGCGTANGLTSGAINAWLNWSQPTLKMSVRIQGGFGLFDTLVPGGSLDQFYKLRVDVLGACFNVFLDEEPVLSALVNASPVVALDAWLFARNHLGGLQDPLLYRNAVGYAPLIGLPT